MQNDIRDVFAIFHDGSIIDCEGVFTKMTLTIQCNYLAQLINSEFKNFYVDLIEINKLDFDPWMNPTDLKKIDFKSHEDYLKADLEILSAEIKGNYVLITCNQHDPDSYYSGGDLMVSASNYNLYDHNRNPVTVESLNLICQNYWANVKSQKR